MKRFDSESIYYRIKQRLEVMNEWSQVIPNGTISSILKAWSETGAEYSRYLEYLYQEKKYLNARNLSSITHMTDLVGYKRNLPKSAIGYVIVTHTDKNGVNRLENYGVEFFDLDAASDYDELTQNKSATTEEKSALVPWTANKSYAIPEGSVITSSNGTKFLVTETVESRSLKEPFSVIKKDPVKYASFIEAGGWNGIKYLKVPVIQGEQVSAQLGEAAGTRFESFVLDALDVENASNIISEKYFTLTVKPSYRIADEEATEETWYKVENVGLAGPYDRVFEVKILDDEGKLLFKFGNGITGKLLPAGALVTVNYLKTLGEAGNILSKFQMNTITFPNGEMMVDPRTNEVSNFICCTNISPINGGHDIEDTDDIRASAPVEYLSSYTISSKKSYLKQILDNSPVNLLHTHIFDSEVVETESYGESDDHNNYTSSYKNGLLQEVTMTKNCLLVCALRSNGEEIEDPELELIEPLTRALDDYMSPNDSLDFIKPNLVKLCPRIKVGTKSSILEQDIIEELRPKIYSAFSVFSRDFGEKFFESKMTDIAHNLPYTKKVDGFLEAKATVDMEPTIITKALQTGTAWLDKAGCTTQSVASFDFKAEAEETLFAFDFHFDKLFAQNKLEAGFRNYKYHSPYLIKVNVTFKEAAENSRTFFLFDNRTCLRKDLTVMDAYFEPIDENVAVPSIKNKDSTSYGSETIRWHDDYSEDFTNLQCRTAQFTKISNITDVSFMDQAKSFLNSPFEIRPLFINDFGKNEVFSIKDVPSDEQVSLNLDANVVTTTCYRKNYQFWPHTRIEFYECYDDPNSVDYARGRLIVPINKILTAEDLTSLKTLLEDVEDFDEQTPDIEKMIKEKVKIEVFAQPVQTTFECEAENDLISVDKDDIQIEKLFVKD